jgi:hypothetical protein
MRVIIQLLLLLCPIVSIASDTVRKIQEDDIREAVFRYEFEHNGSALQRKAKVYFIQVGQKYADPSDEFMLRFAGHFPPVRKRSEFQNRFHMRILDRSTEEQGLLFTAGEVTWISDKKVEVAGGYNESDLSASCSTYTLKKRKGKWTVTKDKQGIIS